ncbi:MAG: response regulator [bacterium]|nr:response regulator [bacterium]
METAVMVDLIREQYGRALGALVPTLQDQVITADPNIDLPVLRRVVNDFKQYYPAVRAMKIRGRDGTILVETPHTLAAEKDGRFTLKHTLQAGEHSVGEVELVIDLRDIEIQAGQHALKLQLLFAALLLLTAVVLIAGFYRLAIRPLRKIDEKLRNLVAGDEPPLDDFKGAEEFLRLNDSVESLASAAILRERKQELELQLEQSQKLEAVGRLAGGVAHDFNNLLTVILGYAADLVDNRGLDESLRGDVSEIITAGERAATLTRQLLAFSRKQVLRSSVVDPIEVLHRMEEMLQRLIGEGVIVNVEVAEGLGNIDVDRSQFEQVIMNLAVNSRDAMDGWGQLDFALDSSFIEANTVVPVASASPIPAGRYVVLSVRDTGAGMDAATLSRIFEPFFTTKPLGEGTGLGLAMVYGIVSQSNGFMEVQSTPNEGTVFKVYLPSINEIATKAAMQPDLALLKKKLTILIVEDEELVRQLAQKILEKDGHRVLTAANADDAFRICDEVGEGLDLIITDLVLPGLSGFNLSLAIQKRLPEIKVLLVSGFDNGILEPGNRSLPFLQKPFTRASLLSKVREVMSNA